MAPAPKQSSSGHDWENDSSMKKLLEKKRKAEEAELYNQEETMALKRRAVKLAAERTPIQRRSSEYASASSLNFDDDITPSIDTQLRYATEAIGHNRRARKRAKKQVNKQEMKVQRKSGQKEKSSKSKAAAKIQSQPQRRKERTTARRRTEAESR